MTFTVQVDVTDRTRTGLAFTVTETHTVTIDAPDPDAATLAAAQMVAGRIAHDPAKKDHMVIDTRIVV